MKNILKKIVLHIFKPIIIFLISVPLFSNVLDIVFNIIRENKLSLIYKGIKLKFYCPNRLIRMRIKTFSTKEPETLNWIDSFEENKIFWDIGSNIGLYSIYASKTKFSDTYSFEPSMLNVENLIKNINLNNLANKIMVIPFPITNYEGFNDFSLSNDELGGALSNFGDNKVLETNINKNLIYKIFGLSGDQCINKLNFKKPDYIKIDVDGIENLILEGLSNNINNTKSLLVEIDQSNKDQSNEIKNFLEKKGFKLDNSFFENSNYSSNIQNQIWVNQTLNE